MLSLDDLPGAAEAILAAFAAQLEAQGVDLPDRQYVAPALMTAYDGPQLTVMLGDVSQGQPGSAYGGTFIPPQAINFQAMFIIELLRAVVSLVMDGTAAEMIPDADDLNSDGLTLMTDAAALVVAATTIRAAYTLTDPGQGFVVGPLQPVGPEGAVAGHRLQITVSLS